MKLQRYLFASSLALGLLGATFTAEPAKAEINETQDTVIATSVQNQSSIVGGMIKTVLYLGGGIAVVIIVGKLGLGFTYIPDDKSGIVRRYWSTGPSLANGKIIATDGEPGIQAEMLMPGAHWFKWPWMYSVEKVPMVTIPPNQIAVVSARDGQPLGNGQILGRDIPECNSFQDAAIFLKSGGQKGRQLGILTPGDYRINTEAFDIYTSSSDLQGTGLTPEQLKVVQISEGQFGIVVTNCGQALGKDDIAACRIEGHDTFQDPQAFLDKKGFKGLQEEGLLPGQYFINPWFASTSVDKQMRIEIGEVGVVTSFIDESNADQLDEESLQAVEDATGDLAYIVPVGQKGVWAEPLGTGKYPINPETRDVQKVPITNIVLNWDSQNEEAHGFDHDLETLDLVTTDGFNLKVKVAQVIYIRKENAPYVIARMGSMKNLVANLLEPIISGVFRDIAQLHPALEFVTNREFLRKEASDKIHEKLTEYRIEAIDTVIGYVEVPENLLKPIKDRQLAKEQEETYQSEQKREEARRTLEEMKANANIQAEIVAAQRKVEIEEFEGQAKLKRANGEAEATKTLAQAEAASIEMVGIAQAQADQKRRDAVGGPQVYAAIEVSRQLAEGGIPIVPQISLGGGENSKAGIGDALLANMLVNADGEKLISFGKDSDDNQSSDSTEENV